MAFLPQSLRNKVLLGYTAALALMLVVAAINWHYLNGLERMIQSGEKVSGLFETTLEIRRFEKNYFLYQKDEDYRSLLSFVDEAEGIMGKSRPEMLAYAGEAAVGQMREDLRAYRELLERKPAPGEESQWEIKIRARGKAIVTAAEGVSKNERKIMQARLEHTRRSLALSVILITAAWFAGGALFYRMFVRPLGKLERHMKKVAEGEFLPMPLESNDREIVSLNSAFNRMLLEIEWRQSHLVQSEKLASFGTLLFGVAHELNNPLSNISTSVEILQEEIHEAEIGYKKELLQQIETETDRAREIVRSLLDYSRAGKKETVNLGKLIEESVRFIRGELPAKIEIIQQVPNHLEFFADRQRLQQVFINLLKNAIDAIKGEGLITINARPLDNDRLEIDISDTGSGMPPEVSKNIFDPFFTTKETKKGYGLGLFIVHSIIKEHGGTIDVDSRPGSGTAFIITLPIKGADIDARQTSAG